MTGAGRLERSYRQLTSRFNDRALAVICSSPFGVAVAAGLLLVARSGDVFDPAVVPILWAGTGVMGAIGVYAGLRRRITDAEWAVYTGLIMALLTGLAVTTNESIVGEQLTSTLMFPPLMAAVFLRPRLVAGYGAVAVVLSGCVPWWAGEASSQRLFGSALISVSITVATGFVSIMRSALDQARHRAELIAVSDQLTGLLNRRGMAQQFPMVMALAQRNSGFFAALVADVDHFKSVNDSLGHQAGDEVLQRLATVIRESVRPGDLAVRLGGEEFAVLTVVRHAADAELMAERLRECVAAAGREPAVTISIGVAYATIEPGVISDALLDRFITTADALLYDAKAAGRNCVRARELDEAELGTSSTLSVSPSP